MDDKKLADLLFPNPKHTREEYEKMYPVRELPSGAIVTRFAPSPTGFLHIGSINTCNFASRLARQTNGKFILRLEDTDKKREVPGAVKCITSDLDHFNIFFDEGQDENNKDYGDYGPYRQSERKQLYMDMARTLVEQGKAYPCFCSEERLAKDREMQEQNKELLGYYGSWAHCRGLTYEEIEQNIKEGKPFAIRLKVNSSPENKIVVHDAIRGELRLGDNYIDPVILKSDFLPPYNFAHACDDHFMRVNLVIRGDEYIPSIAEHMQIFKALNFEPIKYAHIAPVNIMDGASKRKISKRKDPEAKISYYLEQGYPFESVTEYLLNLTNSNYEQWRRENPTADNHEFTVRLDKMSISGPLFDLPKLLDISKTVISGFSAETVFQRVTEWAQEYDKDFYNLLIKDKDYSVKMFNIERETPKPRKDICKWSDCKELYFYFFDELFDKYDYEFDSKFDSNTIGKICQKYADIFDEKDDKTAWFEKIKYLGKDLNFATDMKEYKANPQNFAGNYSDVAGILRMAITKQKNTPDLYEICKLLGKNNLQNRLTKLVR